MEQVRQKTYELAMTVVMENHLESIVVENTATVTKCIEHLKEQKWHPMTFLPLDSISASPPDQRSVFLSCMLYMHVLIEVLLLFWC